MTAMGLLVYVAIGVVVSKIAIGFCTGAQQKLLTGQPVLQILACVAWPLFVPTLVWYVLACAYDWVVG